MPSAGDRRSNETDAASAIAPNAPNSSQPFSHRSGRYGTPSSSSRPVSAGREDRAAPGTPAIVTPMNRAPATASVA